ncbi:MAG: heavy metal translocating P-type ATPase, partial [Clostridia bacterium]|nr:heavy metal translocating P-type ATPase [Clostridia bacterium]
DQTVQVPIGQIQDGDCIEVSIGSMIPLDGVVVSGEALVNQAALTGESIPVEKRPDSTVFAGTVVEEGALVIQVHGISGETRYDRIVRMIEESESMSSVTQSRAERVVSSLIPYTFGTAVLTGLLTRNVTKAASVLMVDFSCAIEVAMPIAVLSAMREASRHQITVKGGKFLELISEADTVVFDKTGTLTYATPVVEQIVTMEGRDENDMLSLAACLEEHFPHSLANAVVKASKDRGLRHTEIHSKPTYIVAHGIVSTLDGQRVVLGSYHFVLEDENAFVSPEDWAKVEQMPLQYSRLYMAIGGRLAAVIGIADPIKAETAGVIAALRQNGIRHIVMMTGDSEKTAAAIASEAGIDEYYSEVRPEDKARYVQQERDKGRKVIMIGDGINDSPALSAADVGIAMKEGADIAREIADITLSGRELEQLITLKQMSHKLMSRMNSTARFGIAFNAAILVAGIAGLVVPGTAALLHNASTIGLCLENMTNLLPERTTMPEPLPVLLQEG